MSNELPEGLYRTLDISEGLTIRGVAEILFPLDSGVNRRNVGELAGKTLTMRNGDKRIINEVCCWIDDTVVIVSLVNEDTLRLLRK